MPENKFRLCWYQPAIDTTVRHQKQVFRMIVQQYRQKWPHLYEYRGKNKINYDSDCFYRIELIRQERVIYITKAPQVQLVNSRLNLYWPDMYAPRPAPAEVWFESQRLAETAFSEALIDPTNLLTLSVL